MEERWERTKRATSKNRERERKQRKWKRGRKGRRDGRQDVTGIEQFPFTFKRVWTLTKQVRSGKVIFRKELGGWG